MLEIDLTDLPVGSNYETTYGEYLKIFKAIQYKSTKVINAPRSWVPLLVYLGADVYSHKFHFVEDEFLPKNIFDMIYKAQTNDKFREYVEHVCALRPELVDALWKIDNQWYKDTIHKMQEQFIVSNYSAFFRPEIMNYLNKLHGYRSTYTKCVLTNCAADKPYPSDLHMYLKRKYPDHELVICTGVLGVLPEPLWNEAPQYDSGLPNFWRMQEELTYYLRNNRYNEIVVHTEFNQQSILKVLPYLAPDAKIIFAVPYERHTDYINLMF